MVELEEIVKNSNLVIEGAEVVGVWEFDIKNCEKKLKIKVVKFYPPAAGGLNYMGITNLRIQNYRSLTPRNSAQSAIEDALSGFLMYWDAERAEEIEPEEVENW